MSLKGFRQACKQKTYKDLYEQQGFTLIELMVVLSIFLVILGVLLANLAGLRTARNLKIAQNELVSNIRKVQSYSLSSRALNGTQAVQYYLLKFDTTTPDRYFIQAIYDASTSPKLVTNVETIFLPQSVRLASSSAILIDKPPLQFPSPPSDSTDIKQENNNTSPCALLAFRLPFAKIIINGGKDLLYSNNTGCTFASFTNDDYAKIKNFVANSSSNTAVANSIFTITLASTDGKLSKTVSINGLTGAIVFSP
ncbi:MAG: type II secretion system protein [Candidatus Doudnabacteria bacterium]|nr:type II secretion system protein [Candidatus Doudnabacteria bacterium]